jgi:uncharacterized protein (DUF362 family)
MTRRELLTAFAAVPVLTRIAKSAPTAPVAIGKCQTYDAIEVLTTMSTMCDQIGGLGRLVANKTVTVKVNLTGAASERIHGLIPGRTHYTHPQTVMALCHLLDQAGARRIRIVEGAFASNGPLEDFLRDSGWNLHALTATARNIEFENTNVLGKGREYHRVKVPGGGLIFPAWDLNHSYVDTDVFVSMAKLKNHANCGVTLSMKNCFGITPISIYGDDAGVEGPNENPTAGRGSSCHAGSRGPSKSAPQEVNPQSPRDVGYRMPRITAELAAARPIHLAFIDGVETVVGGEGPWVGPNVRPIKPGIMLLGTNPVATDTVATAVMGYNPRALRGDAPFRDCDNTLLLAESLCVGTADLNHIEVAGVPIARAMFPFEERLTHARSSAASNRTEARL